MHKKVLTSDGYSSTFDKAKIIEEVRKNCAAMGVAVTEKQLETIATNTEESIKEMKPKHLTGSLIRSVSLIEMLDLGLEDVYKACAKVGMPIADIMSIWQVEGDSVHDNANLDGMNQETQHKHIADKICKEAVLTLLPNDVSKSHIEGNLHCHDQEYFTNRQFCANSDLRFILYYGLWPDGVGKTLPVARAAQNAEVAFLHAAKALGSSQCNCSITPDEPIVIRRNGVVSVEPIRDVVHSFGTELIEACVFDPITCKTSFSEIADVLEHETIDPILEITTSSGRHVKATTSHSVYVLRDGCITSIPSDSIKIGDFLVVPTKLPSINSTCDINILNELRKHTTVFTKPDGTIHLERSSIDISTDIKITPELFRLLGYYASEGWLIQHGVAFCMGIKKFPEGTDDLVHCIRTVFNIEPIVKTDGIKNTVYIYSKLVSLVFEHVFNTGNGAYNKKIPAIVYNASIELKKHYLSGYLCDGHCRRREISWKTASVQLAHGITTILEQIGVTPHMHPDGNCIKITVTGNNLNVIRDIIPDSRNNLMSLVGTSVSRYPDAIPLNAINIDNLPYIRGLKTAHHKSIGKSRLAKYVETGWLHNVATGDLGFDEVVSIKIVPYSGYVYDVSVPGKENFIGGFGNICLHNSGGQGYNSFNVLIAPYLYMKTYDEIKQLAQLFIYEMGQMIVARGSQVCFSSIQLYPGVPAVWWDRPVVYKGQVWDGEPREIKPMTQEDHVWSFGGKTCDGRYYFNRRIIETEVLPASKVVPRKTYGQYDREARLLFKAFMEIYTTGDIRGRPFTFPKAEVVFSKEFMDSPDFDKPIVRRGKEWFAPSYKELYQAAIKLALVNGTPYFESQYHEENPLTSINCTQCCAYSFALSEEETVGFNDMMNFKDGAHFDSLGSMQVVSLNLPRAAYVALESEEEDKFMSALKYLRQQIDVAVKIFNIKREFMKKQASPFMRQQVVDPNDPEKKSPMFFDLDKLTYVIGMVGLNEFVQALTGKQLHESDDAVVVGQRLVGSLNLYCGKVGHENGMSISLARTPAETTAQRFAVQDLIRYPKYAKKYVKGNIKEAIKMLPYKRDVPIQYSNGTHLAVDAPVSLEKKIEIEGSFFDILKGGNIFHIFLDDIAPMLRASELGTGEIHQSYIDDTMAYVFKIFRETPINYLAITKDSTICNSCNSITPGINEKCPKCGSTDVDFFSRITGYLEPISQWNAAKKQEFIDRHRYGETDVRG